MITATQLRELRETLQDLIAVAPDTEAGRAAVLRAHNLNNVHNWDEVTPAKNPVQYTAIPVSENTIKAGIAMQAINNNLLILKHLSESKIGKLRIQLTCDGQPVPNGTVVLRMSWWQRNSSQVKRLINTLSRKKFGVKQEGKYLIICQPR